MTITIEEPNYIRMIGRLLQDKHDFHNQARITGFRKKGKKLRLQLQYRDGSRHWHSEDTVATYWDFV